MVLLFWCRLTQVVLEKGPIYFGFVDLEKAFDRVSREVITWAMHKLGVAEWLVSAVMSVYTGAKAVVRTVYDNSNYFEVKVQH